MKKIKTLFKRDPDTFGVVDELADPEFEAVLAGEWLPTFKLDGTPVLLDTEGIWVRRQVKGGGRVPKDFRPESRDGGKIQGWVPLYDDWGYYSQLTQAFETAGVDMDLLRPDMYGTAELVGPGINGNRHELPHVMLIPHGTIAVQELLEVTATYDELRDLFAEMTESWEGVVWHGPGGGMAKLKRTDFR